MAQVIVITSGKGGVGKSTITTGLGAALSRRGRKVLLIDCDSGLRCLDHLLGISQQLVFDIADVVLGNCSPVKATYACDYYPGLYLLPAPRHHESAVTPAFMKQIVSFLGRYFDMILLDSPAGLGRGFEAAVSAAQHAFVVATPDPLCLRDSDLVRQALSALNMQKRRLILNKFNYTVFRKSNYYQNLDQAIDAAGIQLLGLVPDDMAIMVSAANGKPLSPDTPAAASFQRIAARIEGERVPVPLRML